jgi:starch phosphorylase
LEEDGARRARELAHWKLRVREAWPGVTMQLMVQPPARLYQDEKIVVQVTADLNGLQAADVKLECLLGRDRPGQEFEVLQVAELSAAGEDNGLTLFELEVAPQIAGLQHYRLRMFPYNDAMSHRFELGCMIWI